MRARKTKTAERTSPLRGVGLRFERGRILLALDDGREISAPLHWYPTLESATPSQRARWTVIGPGVGFHWEDLDLDLSVEGIAKGLIEAIPTPPRES